MKFPIIITSYNRPRLLKQTLESLIKNTDSQLEIIIIDDCSTHDTWSVVDKISYDDINWQKLIERKPIGYVRNEGIRLISSDYDFIYFSDDDIYFLPHWDTVLLKAMERYPQIKIIGGRRHPHHRVMERWQLNDYQVTTSDNQAGYSLLVKRDDFNTFGKFKEFPLDTRGYEDSQFVEFFREKGGIIAAVEPPVLYHCGIQGTNMLPAADYNELLTLKREHPEIIVL